MRTLSPPDVQAERPRVAIGLSRVGVTDVERLVRVGADVLDARFSCAVSLAADQRGAHMSRFEEAVDEALAQATGPDDIAPRAARLVRERQGAAGAHVTMEARRGEERHAPASGLASSEIAVVLDAAWVSEHHARRALGVRVQGITACPCAQDTLAARARERLLARGLTDDQVDEILADVPVATHNQRGLATLRVGVTDADGGRALSSDALRAVARDAMSAETYELLKRSDEADVVERAHRRPRFVEDCVREMLAGVADLDLADDAVVQAHQRNLETIHRHDVVAQRTVRLGDLRAGLGGGEPLAAEELDLDGWLRTPGR